LSRDLASKSMNASSDTAANDLGLHLDKLRRIAKYHFRWLTRSALLVLAASILLHLIHPTLIDWLGEALGFAPPSIAATLGLMLLIFLLERFFVLEELILKPAVRISESRTTTYRDLTNVISSRRSVRLDLIQFTGQRAISLLRDLAERAPALRIRILLASPTLADAFDADGSPRHRERLSTTVYELGELLDRGIAIEWKYYSAPPTLSAVLCDDWLVAMSWYYYLQEEQASPVVRLRSRLAPAVVGMHAAAGPLISFARNHFDNLWQSAATDSA
jgi:hypothetical protein